MSPIDKIFQEIFGYLPEKAGTAYEMLSCIAEHILSEGNIVHDKKIRGEFSKTLYQIDVLSQSENQQSMGEAKDYTIQNKKVGRGDLQKLGGAIPDLPTISKGKFYSATGFTGPARKYATSSGSFPHGKEIELYEFRPSTEKDEEGTLKTIRIAMKFVCPHPQSGKWAPHFTKEGKESCRVLLAEGESELHYNMALETFYGPIGEVKLQLFDLTGLGYGAVNEETRSAHGCFLLKGYYIYVEHLLVELNGLEYEVPYTEFDQILELNFDSKTRFVVKDSSGEIVRFISDENIRGYDFDENGQLLKP